MYSVSGYFGIAKVLTGRIRNNPTFYYKEFPTYPSMSATIEYHIKYLVPAQESQCAICRPNLDIYTTKSDANFFANCSVDSYGQLRNENLHTPLNTRHKEYRFTNCTKDHFGILYCFGEIQIQDFKPRKYGFSFGYDCSKPFDGKRKRSLKGLSYNVSIYDQTNVTKCYHNAPYCHGNKSQNVC